MSKNMFPVIAVYNALRNNEKTQEETYDLTLCESQKSGLERKMKNEKYAKYRFSIVYSDC